MNVKTITMWAVGLVVGVVLFAGLIYPVVNNATATHGTFTNEGAYYMNDAPGTHTLIFEGGTITIDGEVITPHKNTILGSTILATENIVLRYVQSDKTIQFAGASQFIPGITAASLTISDGTITGTCTASGNIVPISYSYTQIYYATPTIAPDVMTEYNGAAYLSNESEIYALGFSQLGAGFILVKISGTIDNLTTEILDLNTGQPIEGATASNVTVDKTAIVGYDELYRVSKITFDVSNGVDTSAVTFTAYIVPTEVIAEKTQHLGDVEISLLKVVPLLAIITLVVFAAGTIYSRRA